MDGSTVVITPLDGDMGDYLRSIERLQAWRPSLKAIAPAHGHVIPDPKAKLDDYLTHRLEREAQVLATLQGFGAGGADTAQLVEAIYTDVPEFLWPVARFSVWAHLRKLDDEGTRHGGRPRRPRHHLDRRRPDRQSSSPRMSFIWSRKRRSSARCRWDRSASLAAPSSVRASTARRASSGSSWERTTRPLASARATSSVAEWSLHLERVGDVGDRRRAALVAADREQELVVGGRDARAPCASCSENARNPRRARRKRGERLGSRGRRAAAGHGVTPAARGRPRGVRTAAVGACGDSSAGRRDRGEPAALGVDQAELRGEEQADEGGDEGGGQQRQPAHLGHDERRAERRLGDADVAGHHQGGGEHPRAGAAGRGGRRRPGPGRSRRRTAG